MFDLQAAIYALVRAIARDPNLHVTCEVGHDGRASWALDCAAGAVIVTEPDGPGFHVHVLADGVDADAHYPASTALPAPLLAALESAGHVLVD